MFCTYLVSILQWTLAMISHLEGEARRCMIPIKRQHLQHGPPYQASPTVHGMEMEGVEGDQVCVVSGVWVWWVWSGLGVVRRISVKG